VALVAVLLAGCTNESARAPNPASYAWPDRFAYRVQTVSETDRDTEVLARFEEEKLLQFTVRDDHYLVWHDSITKRLTMPGAEPTGGRLYAEDTLRYYLRLTRLGAFEHVEAACDPTVPECANAYPSDLPLELRHVVPRLPVWWPPKGHEWVDTLKFDDLPRPGAARGRVVTTYRDLRDTVIAGHACWVVSWHARRESERPVGAAMVADPPTEERGDMFVDKRLLIPVFAGWYGAAAAPPALRAAGATANAHQGRAWLIGGVFDSLQALP
jgi:hypothetical protein